jgi:peptidoglycan/LPS O-acetylase OafA/YrhL
LPRYRPEIDGLRAIAVVAVMLYHAGFATFSGGYTGVDIFFVISGYLISGIIVRGLDDGSFTWRGFIERRVRRILPALFVMLVVCLPIAWIFLLPDELQGFSSSLGSSALFAGNLYFWRVEGGYFGLTTDLMPLRHLWSLAVEEQFYLLFPLALMLVWRFAHRRREVAVLAMLVISLGLCALAGHIAPAANFYLLPMRAWEFLAGSALVMREMRRPDTDRLPRFADLGAVIGLIAVVVPVFLLDLDSGFPWPWALPSVIGSALLIACTRPSHGIGRLLALPPFVGIGLISYSAYLWHQPLLAFSRAIAINSPSPLALVGLLIASLGLATLSWRFVEQPFRRRTYLTRRTLFSIAAIGSVAFASIGAVGFLTHGAPERLTPQDRRFAAAGHEAVARTILCMAPISTAALPRQPCITGRSGPVKIATLGDSHAASFAPAILDAANAVGARAIHFSHAGCPPILSPTVFTKEQSTCAGFNARAVEYIRSHPTITTVILAARWTYYVERVFFDNGEGGVEIGPKMPLPKDREKATIAAAYKGMVDRLIASGKSVVLIYPVPEPGWDIPRSIAKMHRMGIANPTLTTSAAMFVKRNAGAYAALDSIGLRPGLTRLYPARAMCPSAPRGRCITTLNGEPLYYDDDHLSAIGARFAVPDLAKAIR